MNNKNFKIGPFKIKYEPCLPIHIYPNNVEKKSINVKIPWKCTLIKSNKIFIIETRNLTII